MRKLIAMLLALCMCLGFAACGSEPAAPTEGAEKSDAAAAEAAEPLDKVTIWSNAFANSEECVEYLCSQFKADTGVELEWVGFPKEDYDNVVMASLMSCDEEDLPDVIFNAPLGTMLRQELLIDMAPLFENNEAMSKLINEDPTLVDAGRAGEKIYSISSVPAQSMVFWTRQDLVDELGLKQPKNLDDFTAALRAIKEAHPEMIPLSGPSDIDQWDVVSGWFGVKNKVVQNAEGKFVDYTLTPEYKEYMDYMKGLYAEGLLDKELPTNTSMGDVRSKYSSGQTAVTVMWDNLYLAFKLGLDKNGQNTLPVYMEPVDGDRGTLGMKYTPAQNVYCMTVGVGDQARAQQVFDTFLAWMYTTSNGILASSDGPEGVNWVMDAEGYRVPTDVDIGIRGLDNVIAKSKGWEPPYKDLPQEFENIQVMQTIRNEMIERQGTVIEPIPGPAYVEYCGIAKDLMTKRTELFHLYITGQTDYDTFTREYQAYCDERNLQSILDAMNAQ